MRPSTTSTSGTFIMVERHEPGHDREDDGESAGKPADLHQHIIPSLVVPLSDLAPPCVGTGTD